MASFYEILQLSKDATVAEIRAAYKRKALEVHLGDGPRGTQKEGNMT